MRVEILDEAEQDLVDGARFYEAQDSGLGQYFLDSLFSDIDSLQLYAGIHPVQCGYHRLLSRRFPYAVYYRVAGSVARVWAILDCRRDPQKIAKRLTQGRS
jgi:plasmid stabilization system protein ParE